MPIRLLFLVPGLSTGGSERLVHDIAIHLDRGRFAPRVAAFGDGPLRQGLEARGVPVTLLHGRPGWGGKVRRLVAACRALRSTVRDADVVHSHHLGMLLHASIAGWPSRRWAWVHTEHTRPDVELTYPRWLVALGRALLRRPDVLTGVSPAVTSYFVEHVPELESRALTIANAVDLARFGRFREREAKRRELGIPANAWVAGTVGSLRPQKNQALLLQAFRRVLAEVPTAWLVVVGEGEMRSELERVAQASGVTSRVLFLGSRLDVPTLLGAFDAYCLSSHYEGMPLSMLEAMASSLPVVATAVPGIREWLIDGATALVVRPNDHVALARALVLCAEDRRGASRMASAGRAYVERHFRFDVMVEHHARLYEILAGGGHVLDHPLRRTA